MRLAGALGLVAVVAGCATLPPMPPLVRDDGPRDEVVYVIQRGWHTDISLAADEVGPRLAGLRADLPGARFLVIGFGERAYLLHRDHDSGDLLAALFPGPGALLVTGLRVAPQQAFPAGDVIALRVTARERVRLDDYLAAAFDRPGGAPHVIATGPYDGSTFFAATQTYSAGFTCNTWTAEALQTAGLPVHAEGVVFADGVADQARQIAVHQARQVIAGTP